MTHPAFGTTSVRGLVDNAPLLDEMFNGGTGESSAGSGYDGRGKDGQLQPGAVEKGLMEEMWDASDDEQRPAERECSAGRCS